MKPDQILDKARRKLVAGVAMEDEGTYTLLEEGKMTPAMEALIALRRKNLRTAIEKATAIDAEGEKLREQEKEIILGIEGQPSSAEITALRRVRGYIEGNRERREELYDSSPEAFYGLHLQELRAYKKKAETRRIIETPYVRRQAEDIATHLQADRPVLIYGHLGTGKSELALHVASEYILKDREPAQGALVISGSKNMALAELYGHQMLSVDSVAGDDLDMFTKEVEEKFEEWKAGHGSASEGEKDRAHDRILQAYLTKYKGGTISKFFLGPIYRAMREGRPIIIDEVNAIPHEILISLNHILTRRVGDVMEVQQDSGEMVEIKPGFGVIMTANLNQGQARYVDRQELDPAFLSRLYKIEHDYLPQVAEGSLIDEAGPENELFQVLLARVMDDRGGVELPAGELDKLWKLAQVARVFQDNFAGRTTGNTHFFKQGVAPAVPYTLQESVLSMRALDNIVTQWQAEGYQYELDYYVWKEFGSQSTNPTDRAFIYQQCKDGPGFFSTTGWEPAPNYGTGGKVTSFDVPLPKNRSAEAIYTGQRQVVQCAFGDKEPLRTVWPSVSKKA
jgi:MoxR-like ATPase